MKKESDPLRTLFRVFFYHHCHGSKNILILSGLSGHPVHVSYEFQMVSTDDDNGSDISDRFDDGKSWSRVAYALRKFLQDQRKDGRRIGCIERLSIKW
ncbi:hypothetical protein V1478_003410 [Vespula squamosa]|uniref:Uncharacterized protein n=1 Tax=Vespula squamosa TaxID=30214 RepID=A0ABD2BLS5_VESSQ